MTLIPPEENLKVSVVVPAHNEEDLIRTCLEALAAQESIQPDEYEVVLVIDDCTDATEPYARAVADKHPELRLHFLQGPGKGAGHARRVGMEAACQRLLELGKPSGIIASTDADTVVAPDWLSAQLAHAARGAQAIGGRIEIAGEENLQEGISAWRHEQGMHRHRTLLADNSGPCSNVMEHWQFSGASLALTAAVYEEIGGLEPLAALEDEYLERVLRQRGIPIERPLAVKVKTSGRQDGRAERGLAQDLALASWFHSNTYRASDFGIRELLEVKRFSVSLVLVGEDHSPETFSQLASLKGSGVLDEVFGVSSLPEANGGSPIRVCRAEGLMPQFGPIRGYGDLLWRALSVVRGDIVVFLTPGRAEEVPGLVGGLTAPLMEREELSLVKGFCSPPGPLSELVARPLINLHYPELAGFAEPLSKNFAARRGLLRSLPFPVGAGADISILLDAAGREGTSALAQSFLGDNNGGPAGSGDEDAYAILSAATSRAPGKTSEKLTPGPFFLPGPDGLATRRVPVEERPPLDSLAEIPTF